MKKLLALALAVLALLVPAAAQAADPFGHPLHRPERRALLPDGDDAQRVPSWDGVPLDVDVTLPPTGDGPFPAIVMMHGWGGNKSSFESATPEGTAAPTTTTTTPTSRSRATSCSPPARAASAAPAARPLAHVTGLRPGWVQLADHRYEGRDTQHLLGLLVDQGIVKPSRSAPPASPTAASSRSTWPGCATASGCPTARTGPGAAPRAPTSIAAACPRWGATDLTYSLTPNGRFLDFRDYHVGQSIEPGGVQKQSYIDGLYAPATSFGFYAPPGAPNADITGWKASPTAASRSAGSPARRPRADHLPQHRRAVRRAGAAARAERLDRRPLPRPRGAARLADVPRRQGRAGGAPVRRPRPSARRQQGGGPGAQHPGRQVLRRLPQGRGQGPRPQRSPPTRRPARRTRRPADRSGRAAGRSCTPAVASARGRAPRRSPRTAATPSGRRRSTRSDRAKPCETVPASAAAGTAIASARSASPTRCSGLPTVRAAISTEGRGGYWPRRGCGTCTRAADAGLARHLPAARQPEGQARLPAVRQRLALRARPHGQARAGRQRPELPAHQQLQLLGQGVQAVRSTSDSRSRPTRQIAQIR